MSDSQVYDKPTISLDDLILFGEERAPVGRYKARLIATEVKQTKAGDDFVNAIWEIQKPGTEWHLSEFPIAYYTKTTINKKNPKKSVSRGIGDMVLAFKAAGLTLTEPERDSFPTEAPKLANFYAKKFGRGVYDIAVYEEAYTDKTTGEEKTTRKARVAKPLQTLTPDQHEAVAHETGVSAESDYDDFDA